MRQFIKGQKVFVTLALVGGIVLFTANAATTDVERPQPEETTTTVAGSFDKDSRMSDVLLALGDKKPLHYTANRDTSMERMGRELITVGWTTSAEGKKTRRQSKHFVCTNCHNTDREDADLKVSDPDSRLDYAVKNDIPFLQGTTLWGIVNRESWYNDDYLRKYGDLVRSSRDTLKNAIDLCTIECSQGRPFVDWEMEAVMVYLYSIEIKLGDLELTADQYEKLNAIVASGSKKEKDDVISWFKTQYMTKSPATFMYPQDKSSRKGGANGDAANGKLVYDHSCKTCHANDGVTQFILDDRKMTFKMLEQHFNKKTEYSTYQITRKGTYALTGYRPYMPHYTKERMSDKQLEDLNAYIVQQANQ